jgi:ribosomal protein L25 (general stress protein Ctc)
MNTLTLDTQPREKGNLGSLRKKGLIPAIYYGPGKPSTMITVASVPFGKLFEKAGESAVITLNTMTWRMTQ